MRGAKAKKRQWNDYWSSWPYFIRSTSFFLLPALPLFSKKKCMVFIRNNHQHWIHNLEGQGTKISLLIKYIYTSYLQLTRKDMGFNFVWEEKKENLLCWKFSMCILTWRVAPTVDSAVFGDWMNDKEHRTWSAWAKDSASAQFKDFSFYKKK